MNYYDSSISTDFATGLLAGVMAFVLVIVMIAFIVLILDIIGVWKILKKAERPGWGALIPFYREYLLCEITGVNPLWIVICLCSVILNAIPVIGSLACAAISLYFMILLNVSLARSFLKDDGFAVGLILLRPIFNLILGLGASQYQGPKPMNDVILNKVGVSNSQSTTTESTNQEKSTDAKYCTSCGSKIDEYTRFCPNCGKEVI